MNRDQFLQFVPAAFLLGLTLACAAQTSSQSAQQGQNAKQQSTAKQTSSHKQTEGERIFVQNCARCHTPPDGFSPRISNTVVLHMRVRASLSDHDIQELKRYFNP